MHKDEAEWRSLAGKIGAAKRDGASPERIAELSRKIRVARAERAIKRVIAGLPPLTEGERGRLAELVSEAGRDDRQA